MLLIILERMSHYSRMCIVVSATSVCRNHHRAGGILSGSVEYNVSSIGISLDQAVVPAFVVYHKHAGTSEIPLYSINLSLGIYKGHARHLQRSVFDSYRYNSKVMLQRSD
jgi:hypothetical protein